MKRELERIPGVGPRIAASMEALGIHRVCDLIGRDPEELYRLDSLNKGFREDLCALYLWRAAVYYAEHPSPAPEKLRWWYWKGRPYPETEKETITHESAQ